MQAIERCGEGNSYAAFRARHITLPGLRALGAWGEGRYGDAAALLACLQPFLGDAGGSRVQLAVFESIEREAVRRYRAGKRGQSRTPAAKEKAMPLLDLHPSGALFTQARAPQRDRSRIASLVRFFAR